MILELLSEECMEGTIANSQRWGKILYNFGSNVDRYSTSVGHHVNY